VARALVSAAWQVSFPSLSQNGIIVNAVHSHVNELWVLLTFTETVVRSPYLYWNSYTLSVL
jgi:hypothetical protein